MTEKDKFPARIDNNTGIQLHDNGLRAGSLVDQSLSRLNNEQAQALMAKAGDEALRLEVKNREQNMDYVVGKKVVEDHIETFAMLDKSGKLTRQTVTTDVKTGAGNMRIESKSGAACFVASVAYGDPDHVDVVFLRKFRNDVLSLSPFGRRFIAWYWKNGPTMARAVGTSTLLKRLSKWFIGKIVFVLRFLAS